MHHRKCLVYVCTCKSIERKELSTQTKEQNTRHKSELESAQLASHSLDKSKYPKLALESEEGAKSATL